MKETLVFYNSQKSKIIFLVSLLVSGYWILGQQLNIYRFAFVGAIYEILWIPMLALIVILPIASLLFLRKEKFNIRSLYLYSILLVVTTFFIFYFNSN